MKILFIAPLPPSITSQSLSYQLFLENLEVLKISYDIWIKVKDVSLVLSYFS